MAWFWQLAVARVLGRVVQEEDRARPWRPRTGGGRGARAGSGSRRPRARGGPRPCPRRRRDAPTSSTAPRMSATVSSSSTSADGKTVCVCPVASPYSRISTPSSDHPCDWAIARQRAPRLGQRHVERPLALRDAGPEKLEAERGLAGPGAALDQVDLVSGDAAAQDRRRGPGRPSWRGRGRRVRDRGARWKVEHVERRGGARAVGPGRGSRSISGTRSVTKRLFGTNPPAPRPSARSRYSSSSSMVTDDDDGVRGHLLEQRDRLEPVGAGHREVEQDEVGRERAGLADRVVGRRSRADDAERAGLRQEPLDVAEERRVVVDQEDGAVERPETGGGGSGSRGAVWTDPADAQGRARAPPAPP